MGGLRLLPEGAAARVLPGGVAFFHEEEAVFGAMLEGWRAQRVGGRGVRSKTAASSIQAVERFQRHSNTFPWEWTAGMVDEWMVDLVSVRRLAPSTIRNTQLAVAQFCDYICSPHYGWVAECEARFGSPPSQVCHEWNTTAHLQDYEGKPGRRPLTREELQVLFDHVDAEVERTVRSGRKGAFPSYRDATLLKVTYGWGLRAGEAVGLDVTDFYRKPKAPQFDGFGMLHVRNGKASRGGAPKRRNVASLFGWAVEAVQDYIEHIWPLVRAPGSNALWRRTRHRHRRQGRGRVRRQRDPRAGLPAAPSADRSPGVVIAPESTARCFLCEAIDASARPCLAGRVCGPCWVDASRTATSDLGRRVREFRPRIGSMTISRAIATALPAMEQRIQASLDLLAILEHRGRRPGPDPIDLEALVTELRRLGESATLPRRFGGEPWMKRGDCTRCGRDRQIHHIEGAEELCAACWQCDPASHRTCRRCGAHEYLSYYGICRPCRATDRLASMFTADRLAVHPQLRGPYERLRSSDGRYLASGVLNRSTTKLLRRLLDAGRINHAGLDALGTPAQTRVLRAFLVDSGALPFRDDRLHALEHWIEDTATGLGGADRGTFIRFARWRALRLARLAPMTEGQAAGKRRELAMIRDLLHIVADDGSTLRTMRQAQLDSWLASRPVAARPIVMFIRWCRTSGINTTLTVPMTPKVAWSPGPALTESERLDRLAQVLHPDIDFAPELRLAAGLVMLYAIRPHRIANLARAAIINGPGGVTITLGTDPLLLPEPLDQIALEAVDARTIRRYGGPADDSEWLFPSPLAGRPIHAGTLSARLRAIGIDPRAARNTALADLALRLPPAVVGRLIGVRPRTASRWGGAANQAQAAYAADRASAGASPEPTD